MNIGPLTFGFNLMQSHKLLFICSVRIRTYFYLGLSYLLTIGTTSRQIYSEGTKKMTKSLIACIAFIALAAGLSTSSVQAGEYNEASVEKAAFAVYTPSMATRGERFYVGRD
jgi:hypothetical protein